MNQNHSNWRVILPNGETLEYGDRITLVEMASDPDPVAPGTQGAVIYAANVELGDIQFVQLTVDWDNGRKLMPCCPPDVIEKVTPFSTDDRYFQHSQAIAHAAHARGYQPEQLGGFTDVEWDALAKAADASDATPAEKAAAVDYLVLLISRTTDRKLRREASDNGRRPGELLQEWDERVQTEASFTIRQLDLEGYDDV